MVRDGGGEGAIEHLKLILKPSSWGEFEITIRLEVRSKSPKISTVARNGGLRFNTKS